MEDTLLAEAPERVAAEASRISVSQLTLSHFRNYDELSLDTQGMSVVLAGHNGAGKTNLLEAVSLLTAGKGLRRGKLTNFAKQDNASMPWAISAEVETAYGPVRIGTGKDINLTGTAEKRLIKVDGKTLRGHAGLAEYVSMVWLTPQMDQLFQEGQSARRRFIDRLVYNFDGEHASRVYAFEYHMRERNRLLSEGQIDPHWLDTLEQKMAERSVAIAAARLQTASHINQVMQASPLAFPKGEITLKGMAEGAMERGESAIDAEEELCELLKESRGKDARAGRSSAGAHRTEVSVTHLEKQMEAEFCSTGEQKALLLSIVLAEARAGALWHRKIPILLLDEVIAHLDPNRRAQLYEEIQSLGAQAWMSGTDVELFEGMRDKALIFRVEMGKVSPYF